jgi:quercetin dioxygenase-like cupin family protein
MIKNATDMRTEMREQMRGGKGSVKIAHLFEPGEFQGKARLMARVTLAPGCSIGPHEHAGEEELFYIAKGRGLVHDGGQVREVASGDAIITGGGSSSHAIENIGAEDLELVAVILTY